MDREEVSSADVQAKIDKAGRFLVAAELMLDVGEYDASVSLAVSAGINASDAMILEVTGSFPSGADHNQAVTLLRQASGDSASRQLQFLLGLKHKAQYSLNNCSEADADSAVKRATRLVNKSKGI